MAEQGANTGAGKTERMRGAAVERENEHVAEQVANGPRLDFRPFGGRTVAAPFLPISVKFLAGSVFHERTFDVLCSVAPPMRSNVPDWDRHGGAGLIG